MARVCLSAYGSPVYSKPYLYVPCFDGLTALRVDLSARTFSVAWRSPNFKAGSPIVAGGAVWVLDVDAGILLAIDPITGQVRWDGQVGHAVHFATPAAGGGCVFAASQAQVSAVGGTAGCG
jgi:polyvinyl alcohol dehydrogenase (cytochrome)